MTDSNARDQAANEMAEHTQQWMREVTEEVARLADDTETDGQRREALEQRLADLEERIGSLLTLTELVSLNDNPFVEPAARDAAKAPEGEPAKAAAPSGPSDVTPDAQPATNNDKRNQTPETPTAPAEVEPAQASHPNEVRNDHPAQHVRGMHLHVDQEGPKGEPEPPAPQVQQPVRAHPPAHERAQHQQEPAHDHETHETLLPDGTYSYHGRMAPPSERTPSQTSTPTVEPVDPTQRRLVEVEWAALLARAGRQLDLGAFLAFYVEAEWIDRPTAARVRSLTDQFVRHGVHCREEWDLHDLHVRSIVLLGHGTEHPISPPPVVDEVVRKTRAVANRRWIHPTA